MVGIPHTFDVDRLLASSGDVDGAIVSFYYTGTTNLAPIYTDISLTTPASNPFNVGIGAIVPKIFLDSTITYRRRVVHTYDGAVFDTDPIRPSDLPFLGQTTGASNVGTSLGVSVQTALNTLSSSVASKTIWPKNNKVALLGDSITANSISNTADETRNANRGMGHWVPFLCQQRVISPQNLNFGIAGQTSAQIAARVSDVVNSGAGICIVLAGTNDIGSFTVSQTQANLTTIYATLAANNILIIALPILPRTLPGEANYSFPQKINEWIKDQAKNYPGFKYIDPWLFGDAFSLTYSPRSGHTFDGLHPMAIGAYTLSVPISDYLNTLFPAPGSSIRSVCDYFNSTNLRGVLNTNPMLVGTSGTLGAGVTGQVADNYRVQAFANGGSIGSLTVACSKSVATLFGIVNQRIIVGGTATGGFDTSVIFDTPAASISNLNAGDVIELLTDIEVGGATIGVSGIEACFYYQSNGVYKYAKDGYAIVSDDYNTNAIANATFRTPPITLSGTLGASGVWIKIYLKNTGTTRSADLRINNICLRKVV